jgi:hypothetical protein
MREGGVDRPERLAVVDPGAVQEQHGRPLSALDVVHRHRYSAQADT